MLLDLLQFGPAPPLYPDHPATVTHIVRPTILSRSERAARPEGVGRLVRRLWEGKQCGVSLASLATVGSPVRKPTLRGSTMARRRQMSGMLGVYLVAAELSRLDFIVSPTSRSAAGADLLVTDQECQKAWSVQVKTNSKAAKFWLLNEHSHRIKSDSHVYVFVNLRGDARPEYLVVRSTDVAEKVVRFVSRKDSVWYSFTKPDGPSNGEGWEIFGNAHGVTADIAEALERASPPSCVRNV